MRAGELASFLPVINNDTEDSVPRRTEAVRPGDSLRLQPPAPRHAGGSGPGAGVALCLVCWLSTYLPTNSGNCLIKRQSMQIQMRLNCSQHLRSSARRGKAGGERCLVLNSDTSCQSGLPGPAWSSFVRKVLRVRNHHLKQTVELFRRKKSSRDK